MCEQAVRARRELGDTAAESLFKRLADLEAAEAMLPALPWLPVVIRDPRTVAIEFHTGFHLLAVHNQRPVPKTSGGQVDWSRVERIKISEIEKP
jgi:hypothetical protein